MKILKWNLLSQKEQAMALERPKDEVAEGLTQSVRAALERVKKNGVEALLAMTHEYDGVQITDLKVSKEDIQNSQGLIDKNLFAAMEKAKANIEAFHSKQIPSSYSVETMPGVHCRREFRPIETVGLYVPAGSAPLFSTVLMLAIPAKLAGTKNRVLCTPPQKDGKAHPAVLAACKLCGVDEVFTLGGVQAIGAMAFGVDPVPGVDKIFGPGNAWVTEAKTQVSQTVKGLSIDMPAGPSEVLVIADDEARSEFVAWDLLSQAEHGPDSQALLVTDSERLAKSVASLVNDLVLASPRKQQLEASVVHMRIFVVENLGEAVGISNRYAPEHLILNCSNANELVPKVTSAGSVFVGPWTPESAGDYASGTNHVLPTSSYARSLSGLTLQSFLKSMTVQELTPQGVHSLSAIVETMARAEGLDAHEQAMAARRKFLEEQ